MNALGDPAVRAPQMTLQKVGQNTCFLKHPQHTMSSERTQQRHPTPSRPDYCLQGGAEAQCWQPLHLQPFQQLAPAFPRPLSPASHTPGPLGSPVSCPLLQPPAACTCPSAVPLAQSQLPAVTEVPGNHVPSRFATLPFLSLGQPLTPPLDAHFPTSVPGSELIHQCPPWPPHN